MPIPPPQGTNPVIVLEQFSHLDWDWLNTFPTNVDGKDPIDPGYFHDTRQPANVIYSQAHDLLMLSGDYTYATCEIGFLQAFGAAFPSLLQDMLQSGRLRIVGGGITSPDSLLSNGECFLRNYVVGLQWMQTVSLPWTNCVWLPDDFGHDSQLPATLVAMGAQAVGFARCPLASGYQGHMTTQQPAPQAGTILPLAPSDGGGCDFLWKAADGSVIFAHWMPCKYSQGSSMYDTPPAGIDTFLAANQPCSPTPYVHVPVADDFIVPLGGGPPGTKVTNTLLDRIETWTGEHPNKPAVLSTFDAYVAAVLAWLAENPATPFYTRTFHGDANNPDPTTFRSNPYWMGFYGSRMNIKSGHQQATRILLAAETLDAVLAFQGNALADTPQALLSAWAELVPSTHHDYITGTASDAVVDVEQMPRLANAAELGTTLMTQQMAALAASVNVPSNALVVFNPLGFERYGTVEISPAAAGQLQLPKGQWQDAADGNVLVYVHAPSAGYETFTSSFPPPPAAPSISTNDGGATYTLSNQYLSATVAQSANWALTNVTDLLANLTVVTSGNTFSFYRDGGNIYEFGFECESPSFKAVDPSTISAGQATITEEGPLRVTLSAPIKVELPFYPVQEYTLEYSLGAGDACLQMTLQGQAPSGTSMFVEFAFPQAIASLEHGTPMHWDSKQPATFGTASFDAVIEPTHDFVVAWGAESILGAIYHLAVPGWANTGSSLTGVVLRNTPGDGCDGRGASGSDDVQHTITYALRVPSALQDAATGIPLKEARAYNTPLYAAPATPASGSAPLSLSLASVNSPSAAAITAVKRGTFDPSQYFVRLYQPSNKEVEIVVDVAGSPGGAFVCTALEQAAQGAPSVGAGSGQFWLTTQSAITTVQLPGFDD